MVDLALHERFGVSELKVDVHVSNKAACESISELFMVFHHKYGGELPVESVWRELELGF